MRTAESESHVGFESIRETPSQLRGCSDVYDGYPTGLITTKRKLSRDELNICRTSTHATTYKDLRFAGEPDRSHEATLRLPFKNLGPSLLPVLLF